MPPETLELRELRYFLAVAEELNFTRAAQRLHLAQQALSSAIRNLEADLGVQLFIRDTKRVELTSAGVDNFPNTEIVTVPVAGVEPGSVHLAWRTDDADPTVAAFVASARSTLGRR